MATKTIAIPMKQEGERNKENYRETLDFEALGVDPEKYQVGAITTNYHDVAKVKISGSEKDVSDLAAKSKAHFEEAWAEPV